jgi:hypothetical protein
MEKLEKDVGIGLRRRRRVGVREGGGRETWKKRK